MIVMRSYMENITGIVVLVALLWATTGVSVYSHHCNKEGSTHISFFEEKAKCEHNDEAGIAAPCCKTERSCCVTNKSCKTVNNNRCCSTHQNVFRLVISFQLPGDSYKVVVAGLELLKNLTFDESRVTNDQNTAVSARNRPPPVLFGRNLVIVTSQLKIAPAPIV